MKIILATDGSPCSDAAVKEVARMPLPPDTQVRVICAVEPPAPLVAEPCVELVGYFEESEKISRQRAREIVEGAAATVRAGHGASAPISTEVITGSPKRAIVEEAEAWMADLVVVGSHGAKSWERTLLGSVSQSVAAHARCSVLIVRAAP